MTSTIIATFVAVFAALFPVVNPLGGGPIFLSMVEGCSKDVRNKLAFSVSVNSFFMLLGSMLIGPELLLFFGITLPALKLAGGLVVIAMGWNLLNQKNSTKDSGEASSAITNDTAKKSAFFPLTMPLTIGPGSIATAISLVAANKRPGGFSFEAEMPAIIGCLAGLITLALAIYIVYRESSGIQRCLGENGTNVLMRLFSFILLAIGVQIFLGGLEGFAQTLQTNLASH